MNKLTALLIGSLVLGITACGTKGFVGDPNTIQNQSQGIASDANLHYQWIVAINMVNNKYNEPLALDVTPNGVIVSCEEDDAQMSNYILRDGVRVHGYVITGNPDKVVTACSSVAQIDGAPTGIGDPEEQFETLILHRIR